MLNTPTAIKVRPVQVTIVAPAKAGLTSKMKEIQDSLTAMLKDKKGQILAGVVALLTLLIVAALKIKNPFQRFVPSLQRCHDHRLK